MKKVLVIGASSYIGQKFKDYVSKNFMKELIVDMTSASDGAWRKIDFKGYDAILHLSAIVHRKEKKSMEDLYYEVNHRLAVDVAKKAKKCHVNQFIFMSTAAVYGSSTGCITKDTLPIPTTFYGKSKLAAEEDIIKLQNDVFKVAIVRPPMVYGEGCKGNYPRLVKLAKYTRVFPDYHNKRSVISVDNLSRNIVHLIINMRSGYYLVQDDDYLDICAVIQKVREDHGKKTTFVPYVNPIIRYMVKKRIDIFQKMFGNFYYKKEANENNYNSFQ